MSCYKVKYSRPAEKFIKKNKAIGIRFFKAFDELSRNECDISTYDIKKFDSKSYNDIFRLRIGLYRAIFRVIDNELIIFFIDIGSRGDV